MKLVEYGNLVLCFVIQVHSKGCSLPVSVSDEQFLPVIVDISESKPKLAIPYLGNVELDTGEDILLSCPNEGNTLSLTKTDSAEAVCVKDEIVKISSKNQDYDKIVCSKGLKGSARKTSKKCGGGLGYLIEIGFPVEKNHFLTLIESCYDAHNGNALYTTHVLYGSEIKYASKTSYRPNFSTEEVASGVEPNVAYKKTTQKEVLEDLLGSAKLAERYITSKSYLARGHLSPDADFLFASWQFSTYFYVNTVPQWQAVNNGNWKRVENLAKNTAASYAEDLKVYTGGFEVLSLPDVNGDDVDIRLAEDKLAVPRFVWKILHSEKSGKAIAFISLNNPFLKKLEEDDMLCKDVCDRYGWGNDAWSNGEKGFIYCCDVKELLMEIHCGPNLKIKGILEAP